MAQYTRKLVEFKEFDGLRNTTKAERLSLKDLQVALNVDIDDAKRITRREGFTERLTGAYESLWSNEDICLVVQGTNLKRVEAAGYDYTATTLRSDLTAHARVSYWAVDGRAYYMNGHETGVIEEGASRSFGLAIPSAQPAAAIVGGHLPAGRYQYALTYVRGDQQESGTGVAAQIDLPAGGGIAFSDIPVSSDPGVVAKRIYLAAPNGEVLYRALTMPATARSTVFVNDTSGLLLPLTTQFGEPAPAGHLVAYWKGRALVAQGSVIWPSEPFRHELFMLGRNFLPFSTDINLLAPMEGGFYVGADRTYWVTSPSPGIYHIRPVAEYGAIPGTLSYRRVDGQNLGEGLADHAAMWASPRGHCIGSDAGNFRNLTEGRYSYPAAQRGAGILRQSNGINQYLAVLEGSGVSYNAVTQE